MFFESWGGVLRVLIVGPLAYAALVVLLRVSGKRTLAKLNAFDLVVTVSLGSTLATILLSKSVPLLEGITSLMLLVGLQYVVAGLSVRFPAFNSLVKSEPTLLLREGRFLHEAMFNQRVTQDDVRSALHASGLSEPAEAAAVILETDGSLSVVKGLASRPEG